MKYRKKPIVIEAVQYIEGNTVSLRQFCCMVDMTQDGQPCIETLEGIMTISPNDWLIKGIGGEFYPCKPDIFEATYEKES